jgi:hypothetical protein
MALKDYIQVSLTRGGSAPNYTYNWQNLPVPKLDSGGITIQTNVDAGRNSLGDLVGSPVGRDKIKLTLEYPPLTDAEFRTLLQLFDREQGGRFTFWVKFYDPRYGRKVVRRMYVGDREGRPFKVRNTSTGTPDWWLDVKVNFIEV